MFSRIYIGVHYPLDVISGYVIGVSVSYFLIKVYKKLEGLRLKC